MMVKDDPERVAYEQSLAAFGSENINIITIITIIAIRDDHLFERAKLLAILILFGVMGTFDIPINTSTAMVAAIALGICVDYTRHFRVRYNRLSRSD